MFSLSSWRHRCIKRTCFHAAEDYRLQCSAARLSKGIYDVQVIAATNRADILDPALMRSGRLDRKIEFPHPTEDARAKILQIHSRKMNVSPDVNFEELARSTDDFNAAQLKAVCVEAGMLALRRDATEVGPSHRAHITYKSSRVKVLILDRQGRGAGALLQRLQTRAAQGCLPRGWHACPAPREATEVVSGTEPMLWRDHALDLLQQGDWSGPDAERRPGRWPRCGHEFCTGDSPGMQAERLNHCACAGESRGLQ